MSTMHLPQRRELANILFHQNVSNMAAPTVPEIGLLCEDAADAILDRGYRKPRVINTADELLDLPEASVVIDREGDVSQKRDGLWCGYETAPINSNKLARLASPLTIIHEGAAT